MRWTVPVLGISLALVLTGCSSSSAQDSARPTQAPTAELPSAASSPPSASPVGPVLPSEAELLRTVTMTGEKGQTPEEQSVVEAWREAAARNQVALARSDPTYEPLLRLIGPMLRDEVVAALSDNRRRGEYLVGPIVERVLDVAVSPAGTSAVLQVCEDNSEKNWYES